MQATKRKHAIGVIELLLDEPQRFTFTQLLNLLLRELRRQGVGYERAFKEFLAFRNNLSLSFPASEVQELAIEPKVQGATDAFRGGRFKRIQITPAFIGLLGASGTLPLHDTERIAARRVLDTDTSQRDLLDVLSNRLIGMFYEAWGKYRVEHGLDIRGQDCLLPMLSALAGATSPASRTQRPGQIQPETAAFYAGVLRTRPVSACTVERILADYFGVPFRLEQFVGNWEAIPENRRSTLGVTDPVLGNSAALGVRLWRHDLCARLHIGPLNQAQLRDFLPGGAARSALSDMAGLFAIPTLRYEVRLLLAPTCIEQCTLSTRLPGLGLGWGTFLTGTPGITCHPEIRAALRVHP